MYCKHCGKQISYDAKFCDSCGKSVAGDPVQVSSVVDEPNKKMKKKKKPFYKRWWFWVIIVLSLIGGRGSNESPSATTSIENTAPTIAVETTVAPVETNAPIAAESTASGVTIETAIMLIEPIISEGFENYKISHEDNIITINVWKDGIAVGTKLAASGDQGCLDSWNDVIKGQQHLCSSLLELVQTMGLSDVSVAINVLNDLNTENVLLTTVNGTVLYNCVDE